MPDAHASHACLERVPRSSCVQNPNEGVRSDREQSPWSADWFLSRSRIVGRKVEAVGRWGYEPSNRNFAAAGEAAAEAMGEAAVDSEDDSFHELHSASVSGEEEGEEEEESAESIADSASEEEFGGVDRMRCAEFTLLRLD